MHDLLPFLRLMARRRGWLLLGTGLGVIALAAAIGLLALSGWLIAATAVAGLTPAAAMAFETFRPGAGVRFFALTRTAARYGERLASHEATLRLIIQQWFNPNPEYRNTIRRELAAIREDLANNISQQENSQANPSLERNKEDIAIESEAILSLLIIYLIDAMDLNEDKREQRLARLEKQLLMLVRGSRV